jgi:hypothetical protein
MGRQQGGKEGRTLYTLVQRIHAVSGPLTPNKERSGAGTSKDKDKDAQRW